MSIVAVRHTPSSIGSVEVVDEIVGAVQYEAAPCLDRTADVDRHAAHVVGYAALRRRGHDVELVEEIGKRDVGGALIDDETHRPVLGMRAHVDHRAREARVRHDRHGDEELAVEVPFSVRAARGARHLHGVKTNATRGGV